MSSTENNIAKKHTKVFTFSLRLPALITLSSLLVLALIWTFFLGVMIGRGHKPEETSDPLSTLINEDPILAMSNTIPDNNELINIEDLQYGESLKNDQNTSGSNAGGAVQNTSQPTRQNNPAASTASTGGNTQSASADKIFKYTYQVGSFNKKAQAEQLIEQIQKIGIIAEIEEGKVQDTTWYRVLIHFQGTESEIPALQEQLKQLKVNNILLRKKSAA